MELLGLSFLLLCIGKSRANPDAVRLMEKLFIGYNRLVRPTNETDEVVTVKLKLRLSQLLDVHEKNQIMTTNIWLMQQWTDYKLHWNPEEFGGVQLLHIPADKIWTPDIVLYNNADGNYEVSIMTKAIVNFNGTVTWEPPAIYKSMCTMHVLWFPFDEQYCELRFGSWTYDGHEVDLIHFDIGPSNSTYQNGTIVTMVEEGMDLTDFYPSQEWDIMEIPAKRYESRFDCCPAPYVDIRFYIRLRRKTLFYTVNLIVPCVAISFLAVFVFYLPSDSGEKVGFSISILTSLTVFLLLLVEIIPSTSLVVPLIGLYLLFTMVMVTLSIAVTVITLNVHHRSPAINHMSAWVRIFFVMWLPWFLRIRRPIFDAPKPKMTSKAAAKLGIDTKGRRQSTAAKGRRKSMTGLFPDAPDVLAVREMMESVEAAKRERAELRRMSMAARKRLSDGVVPKLGLIAQSRAMQMQLQRPQTIVEDESSGEEARVQPLVSKNATDALIGGTVYIADHLKQSAIDDGLKEDWQYIAQVLDRLFLWIFGSTVVAGTFIIILRAPSLWDTRMPVI